MLPGLHTYLCLWSWYTKYHRDAGAVTHKSAQLHIRIQIAAKPPAGPRTRRRPPTPYLHVHHTPRSTWPSTYRSVFISYVYTSTVDLIFFVLFKFIVVLYLHINTLLPVFILYFFNLNCRFTTVCATDGYNSAIRHIAYIGWIPKLDVVAPILLALGAWQNLDDSI